MNNLIRILGYFNLALGIILFLPIIRSLFYHYNFIGILLIVSGIVYIILAEVFFNLENIRNNLKTINDDLWEIKNKLNI